MGTSGLGLLTQEDSRCCMSGEINNSMDIFHHVSSPVPRAKRVAWSEIEGICRDDLF